MKKHSKKIIAGVLVLLVLAAAWFWGGNQAEPLPAETAPAVVQTESTTAPTEAPTETEAPEEEETPPLAESEITEATQAPAATQTSAPAQVPAEETEEPTCTLTVRCDAVLQNMDKLTPGKEAVIPQNGMIYPEQRVAFTPGESVFDVLYRELRKHNIHFEFVKTPMYNSVYIEGIGNLYEFDCGDTSGWMYRVNGEKPNYGCSQYQVKNGDNVVFYYSCSY